MENDCLCWNNTATLRVTTVLYMKSDNSSSILTSGQGFCFKSNLANISYKSTNTNFNCVLKH